MYPPPALLRRPEPPAAIGLVLAIPAVLVWLVSMVLPTGRTILESFRRDNGFGSARFTGLDNYHHIFQADEFWKALWVSVSTAILPCLVAVALAPLLALGLDAGGTLIRRIARIVVSVGLVVFSPVAYALAEWREAMPGSGGRWYIRPTTTWAGLDWQIALATLGVVCALVILFVLAALGGRAEGRPVLGTVLLVALLAGLTAAAVALQQFTFSYLSGARDTQNLATLTYRYAFQTAQFGPGAAVATVIGLMVGALGAIAAVIAIAARLRLALVPTPRRPVGQGGVIASVVVLLVTVGLLAVPLIPWVSALSANGQTRGGSYVHTWGPALIHALVAVPLAYLAALGVSGFRPLGKGSEWLLLPLAPWLFVGVTPLAVQGFRDYKDLGLLNDFLGLIPPILVSVPALFLFALFFRGQSARWRAAPEKGFFESVVVPSLPLLGLLIGAVTLIDAQNLLWPLLIMSDPGHATMPEAIAIGSRQYLGGGVDLGTATPWLIVGPALVVLAAAQFRYLDRLVLTSGEKD